MGIKVGVNPPKTPVTSGSDGVAQATTPNVCKMPPPPPPFNPTPLPNAGKSGKSPSGYSTSVEIESNPVAIMGATFESEGDASSKGTGGGLISSNTEGPTKFITFGSPNVMIQGKNVHQLGEPMLNNCGPGGNPPNTGATTPGEDQASSTKVSFVIDLDCEKKLASGKESDKCDIEEMCAMVKGFNESKLKKRQVRPSPSNRISSGDRDRIKADYGMSDAEVDAHNALNNRYGNGLKKWARSFSKTVREKGKDAPEVKQQFTAECRYNEWKDQGGAAKPPRGPEAPNGLSPDHVHDAGQGGPVEFDDIKTGLKWVNSKVNRDMGNAMKSYDPAVHGDTVGTAPACKCA